MANAKTQAPSPKIPACSSHFSTDQIALLAAPLELSRVSEREGGGRSKLSYLEAWDVIDRANFVFGFDGWDSQTLEMVETWSGDRNGKPTVCFRAKVRVTVFVGTRQVVREGTGYGDGTDRDIGKASELATKEAESDAMKRAFRTFGSGFGNALYDKSRENVVDDTKAAAPAPQEPAQRAPACEPARAPATPAKDAPAQRETVHKAPTEQERLHAGTPLNRAISESPEDRAEPATPPRQAATQKPQQGAALAASKAASKWKVVSLPIPGPDVEQDDLLDAWNAWTERLKKAIETAPDRDRAVDFCKLNATAMDSAGDFLRTDIKRWAFGIITSNHGPAQKEATR